MRYPTKRWSRPLTRAQQTLVLDHVWVINALVKRYRANVEDLRQAGWLGLIEAAVAYDPEKGKFSGFAWFRVRHRMRECAFGEYQVMLPSGARNLASRIWMRRKKDPALTPEVAAELFDVPAPEVMAVWNAMTSSMPLEFQEERHVHQPSAERDLDTRRLAERARAWGENLGPNEHAVLHGCILADGLGLQAKVARDLGVSRQHISMMGSKLRKRLVAHLRPQGQEDR